MRAHVVTILIPFALIAGCGGEGEKEGSDEAGALAAAATRTLEEPIQVDSHSRGSPSVITTTRIESGGGEASGRVILSDSFERYEYFVDPRSLYFKERRLRVWAEKSKSAFVPLLLNPAGLIEIFAGPGVRVEATSTDEGQVGEVFGKPVTRYEVEIDLGRVDGLAAPQLAPFKETSFPATVFVDEDGFIRQVDMRLEPLFGDEQPYGITLDFEPIRREVSLEPPPPARVLEDDPGELPPLTPDPVNA